MAFTEDLSTMFELDEFAIETSIVLPADLAGTALVGIFDAAYALVDMGSGIESASPVLTVADSAIPAGVTAALDADAEVALDISGTTYSVVERRPDGTGVTVLRLRKA
jgi:hypothetical protein